MEAKKMLQLVIRGEWFAWKIDKFHDFLVLTMKKYRLFCRNSNNYVSVCLADHLSKHNFGLLI